MTLDEIKELDNRELLELYADIVRVNHYDPCQTPQFAVDLRAAGISSYDIRAIVLARMS